MQSHWSCKPSSTLTIWYASGCFWNVLAPEVTLIGQADEHLGLAQAAGLYLTPAAAYCEVLM